MPKSNNNPDKMLRLLAEQAVDDALKVAAKPPRKVKREWLGKKQLASDLEPPPPTTVKPRKKK